MYLFYNRFVIRTITSGALTNFLSSLPADRSRIKIKKTISIGEALANFAPSTQLFTSLIQTIFHYQSLAYFHLRKHNIFVNNSNYNKIKQNKDTINNNKLHTVFTNNIINNIVYSHDNYTNTFYNINNINIVCNHNNSINNNILCHDKKIINTKFSDATNNNVEIDNISCFQHNYVLNRNTNIVLTNINNSNHKDSFFLNLIHHSNQTFHRYNPVSLSTILQSFNFKLLSAIISLLVFIINTLCSTFIINFLFKLYPPLLFIVHRLSQFDKNLISHIHVDSFILSTSLKYFPVFHASDSTPTISFTETNTSVVYISTRILQTKL